MNRKETKFSIRFLICSIIAGLLFGFLGEFIYSHLIEGVQSVIFMGVYYAVLGLILMIGLLLAAGMEKQAVESKAVVLSLGCMAALLLCGMLFEFLYELGGSKEVRVADRYIFLIDNSGSMELNDPNQERVAAMTQILANKPGDTQYAVYSFGDQIMCLRQMAPASDGSGSLMVDPSGGTPITGTLNMIQSEFESGALTNGAATQVILLTDGYSTDAGLLGWSVNRPLKYFSKHKIKISTVGFGQPDENLLQKIADQTGGICVMVSNVDQLGSAMQSAVVTEIADRNLLSVRNTGSPGWLYALLRIVFITLLGSMLLLPKAAIVNNVESQSMIVIFSVAGSLLAAILLELGLDVIGLSGPVARILAAVLMCLTPAGVVRNVSYGESGIPDYDSYDDYGGYSGGGGGMHI